MRLVPGESLRAQSTEEGLVRLVRLTDGDHRYLKHVKDRGGYIYQVVEEDWTHSVLTLRSLANGHESMVLVQHVEDLPVDE